MPNNSRKSLYPLLLIATGFLLLVVAVINIFILSKPDDQENVSNPVTEGTFDNIPRVTLSQAKSAYDEGSAVFVDVRDPAYYESSHISGALSIPLDEIASRLDELDSQDWIILYCT